MSKLKPCPFCGGEARYNCFPTDYPTAHCCAYVVCTKCRAEINREGRVGDTRRLKEQVILEWNHRATQPNEPLALDELRQMDGEPVWIYQLPETFGAWRICNGLNERKRHGKLTINFGGAVYENVENYGKTWLAYRRPPKTGKKEW